MIAYTEVQLSRFAVTSAVSWTTAFCNRTECDADRTDYNHARSLVTIELQCRTVDP